MCGIAGLVSHGYEEWGDALAERVDGMFRLAVWDEARGRLTLGRDRVGKKPLYWLRVGGRIAFASEVKALLALNWVPNEVDPEAFPYYLTFGYVPGPGTFLRDVQVVPPASVMTIDVAWGSDFGGAPARRYWSLDWDARPGIETDEACRSIRSLLSHAHPTQRLVQKRA